MHTGQDRYFSILYLSHSTVGFVWWQVVCTLRSHCIMVEIKDRLIYIEMQLSSSECIMAFNCLPYLRRFRNNIHFHEFSGQTAAIDAFCWIYKALSVSISQSGNKQRWENLVNIVFHPAGKWLLISHNRPSRSCLEAVKDVSSAYNLIEKKVEDFGRSLMKIINSKGPSIDPWGTPVEIKRVSEATPFACTCCFLLLK